MMSNSDLRPKILATLKRLKSEKENSPRGWLGYYHNGGPFSYPTAELFIDKINQNEYHVTYSYFSWEWDFKFSNEEING